MINFKIALTSALKYSIISWVRMKPNLILPQTAGALKSLNLPAEEKL